MLCVTERVFLDVRNSSVIHVGTTEYSCARTTKLYKQRRLGRGDLREKMKNNSRGQLSIPVQSLDDELNARRKPLLQAKIKPWWSMIVAASALYGTPCLVIDMGTATTFNYVDTSGAITMGVIQTGLLTSARALAGNTAQLPEVEIASPSTVMAKNTFSAIQTGLYYGFIGGIERMIKQCREETGTDFTVVATGGFGRVIEHDSDFIDIYDPDLIFKGMRIIYEKNH